MPPLCAELKSDWKHSRRGSIEEAHLPSSKPLPSPPRQYLKIRYSARLALLPCKHGTLSLAVPPHTYCNPITLLRIRWFTTINTIIKAQEQCGVL